jgi:hypothetical protein
MADAHMAPLTPQRVNAVIDVAQRAWDGPGWWPRPCARTVRAAAHAAGIEWLVEKVSSGSNSTWVWTVWRPRAADRRADSELLRELLVKLWPDNNGARIVIMAPGMLCIDRNRPEPSESTP